MSAPSPAHCPLCTHLLPGRGVVVICNICGCITVHPRPGDRVLPATGEGPVWAWTGERWLPVHEED